MDNDLRRDQEIGALLRHTWSPFFDRFGRLTSVQRSAIETIYAGGNALVIAPTASGKTEAAAAPVAERLLQRSDPWTVLYVTPTRALVNDLYERLHPSLERCGIRCARRTSEHKDRLEAGREFVITTPESVDSLLCRGRLDGGPGHVFADVSAVVLDEVHLLHASSRGEHLRWLLLRLERLREHALAAQWTRTRGFQRVALSATVEDPADVVERFVPNGVVITVAGGREIHCLDTPGAPCTEDVLLDYAARCGRDSKLLVFCNSRRRADALFADIRTPLGNLGLRAFVHHSGIPRAGRLEAEECARRERGVVLVATSTLELGIDIGDIDVVFLDGPAPNISSLLQRIGRGNRRTSQTTVGACAPCAADALIQAAMIDAARSAWLGPREAGPHFGVARQQVISYTYQAPNGCRSRRQVEAFVGEAMPAISAAELIDHMVGTGELVESRYGLQLGLRLLRMAAAGLVHSNFDDSSGAVVAQEDGTALATGVRVPSVRRGVVAGTPVQFKSWDGAVITVKRLAEAGELLGAWGYVGKPWMVGAAQPQAVRRYFGLDVDEWPIVDFGGSRYLFHFGGARRQCVLWLQLRRMGVENPNRELTPWTVRLRRDETDLPDWMRSVEARVALDRVTAELETLEGLLARPRGNRDLPRSLRVQEVAEWLAMGSEVEALRTARVVVPEESVALALSTICARVTS